MIVKLNIHAEGIFHLPEVHWLTNLDDYFHVDIDSS